MLKDKKNKKKNKELHVDKMIAFSDIPYETLHPSLTEIFTVRLMAGTVIAFLALFVQFMLNNMWLNVFMAY